MDGLSAAASVIAVIQMTQAVGGALIEYYEALKHAREDIQRLYDSIKNLEHTLQAIDDLPRTSSANMRILLEDKKGALSLCRAELSSIKKELDTFSAPQKHIEKLKSLIWPFKRKDVDKHVNFIDKHKDDLILAFGVENLHVSFRNHDILEDIRSETMAAQQNSERRQIIAWLAKSLPDPATEHNIAREKFQPGTGSWLIDGDPLKTWSETTNSFLWLNGGAGAGKSILCSTVIDHIQQLCKKNQMLLFHIATQNVSNMIRSWIRDICSNRRDTPQGLKDVYFLCNHGQQQPTTNQIMEILKCVMIGFRDVYLVVDALDEFPKTERQSLLERIADIRRWKIESTHIFVTSRAEDDIGLLMTSIRGRCNFDSFQNINVKDPNITEDIKKFLKSAIRGFKSRIWNRNLKKYVVNSIAQQADGMFRLAALQLDSLKLHKSESKIRKALTQLPHSLDKFYERALKDIPDSEQNYVKIAFQWISYTKRPITLRELSEAVVVQTDYPSDLEENERVDLLDIIPSAFITIYDADANGKDANTDFDSGSSTKKISEYIRTSHGDTSNSIKADFELNSDGENFGPQSHKSSDDGDEDEDDDEDDSWTSASSSNLHERLYIRFAHFSVKEYLQSDRTSNGPVKQYHLEEVDGLASIAEGCIAYLLRIGSNLNSPSMEIRPSDLGVRFPLFDYAGLCWTYYVQRLENQGCGTYDRVDHVRALALLLLDDRNPAWEVSQSVCRDSGGFAPLTAGNLANMNALPYTYQKSRISQSLSWACFHGLTSLVPDLLNKIDVDRPKALNDSELGSPLYAAAEAENSPEQIVALLLAAGMDPNLTSRRCGYPLTAAVYGNNLEKCKLLVKAGARIDDCHDGWENALIAACKRRSVNICKYLLEEGADIEVSGNYGTPLMTASSLGQLEISKMLLAAGAEVEAEYRGGTTLQYASRGHYFEICRSLLDYGADVNHASYDEDRDFQLMSPLSSACSNFYGVSKKDSDLVTIRLLVEAGADVQAKCGPYWIGGPMASPIVACLEGFVNLSLGFRRLPETSGVVFRKILNILLDAGAGRGPGGVELLLILRERTATLEKGLEITRPRIGIDEKDCRPAYKVECDETIIDICRWVYDRVLEQQEKEQRELTQKVLLEGTREELSGIGNDEVANMELSEEVANISLRRG